MAERRASPQSASHSRKISLLENSSSEDEKHDIVVEKVEVEVSSHFKDLSTHRQMLDVVEEKKKGYRERKGPPRPRSEKQLQVLKETHRKNAEKRSETKRKLKEYDEMMQKKTDEEALSDRIVSSLQNSVKLDEDKVVDKLIGKLSDLVSSRPSLRSRSSSPPRPELPPLPGSSSSAPRSAERHKSEASAESSSSAKRSAESERMKRLLKNRF